jgi:hypothetical protein
MIKLKTTLCALVFISIVVALDNTSIAQTKGCCRSEYSPERRAALEIKKLGLEYQRLKRAACEDCNSSMSDYYDIMQSLGEQLSCKSKQQISKIMGPPDAKKDGRYIYFWRGWHDYLYFSFSSSKGKSQWYYAYE